FLRRQPGPRPSGCGAYVSMPARFGKAQTGGFEDFVTGKMPCFSSENRPGEPLLPDRTQKWRFDRKRRGTRVGDTFDFVIVGAGSGGSTLAGRLSEDQNTSVALLDAGGKNDNWVVTTPFALVLMVAGRVNNWSFNTVPQKGLNGRTGYQPRGKGLGGSS